MTDEMVARLRKTTQSGRAHHLSKADRLRVADRIEADARRIAEARKEGVKAALSVVVAYRKEQHEINQESVGDARTSSYYGVDHARRIEHELDDLLARMNWIAKGCPDEPPRTGKVATTLDSMGGGDD